MNTNLLRITPLLLLLSLTFSGCNFNCVKNNPESISSNETKKQEFYSPYTGEKVNENTYNNQAYMAIIENSKPARPQYGINDADIVFETMAEGGIPRFLALFQKNKVDKIGPIRSMRPYFLNLTKEYNLPFAHCGGSQEALNMISNENLMSINEIKCGSYFWRDRKRKSPHNLFTSSNKLLNAIKEKNYTSCNSSNKLIFQDDYWANNSFSNAHTIILNLNKYYNTKYSYKDGYYVKFMDNTPSIDKNNNKQVKTKNIVIQKTNMKLQKDNLHISINLIGEGDALVFSNGKYINARWFKKDLESKTLLKDKNGNEIPLSCGNTWWHIIDTKSKVIVK